MNPACFGIMCEKHTECARYHAVNGATREQEFIGTCLEEGKRVLFLRVSGVFEFGKSQFDPKFEVVAK